MSRVLVFVRGFLDILILIATLILGAEMPKQKELSKKSGFTIVELLIVVVVIAILAAITLVAYTNIQDRARASEASAALVQAKKKLALYKVDNGSYPTTGNITDAGLSESDGSYQYTSDGSTFCITATSGSVSYKASDTENPVPGGCAGHGQGGAPAITNVANNPSAETVYGWSSNNGSLYPAKRDTSIKRSGSQAIESHHTSDNTLLMSLYAVGSASSLGFPIEENTTYTVSFYFRSGVPHQGRILCNFRLSDGSYGAITYGNYIQGTVDQWTRASHTCTSPAGATMLRLGVHVYALSLQPAGTSAYADDLMVTEGPTLYSYADGSTSNWIWNGAPNGSTSTGPAL